MRLWSLVPVLILSLFAAGRATALEGVYNTGSGETGEPETLDVLFHPCDLDPDLTCGTVIAVRGGEPGGERPMPDGRPVVGFPMIVGLEPKGEGKWRGGRINAIDESLEAGEMRWYGVRVEEQADALRVKGCVAGLCPRTLIWPKVADAADATSARAGAK